MYSDETSIRELLQRVLSYSRASQTEVIYLRTTSDLTRFTNNYVHQNVSEKDYELRVRAIVGKRSGVATTNKLDDESLRRVTEQALEVARTQPEDPEFYSLPLPGNVSSSTSPGYNVYTANYSAEERARHVNTIVQLAKERKLEAGGAFATNVYHTAVANSLGVFAYEPRTEAECHAVVINEDQESGYAQRMTIDARNIDFERIAREAIDKAQRSRNPLAIPAGVYPVVLDAYAVADMLQNLVFMGLSAGAVHEERSFMNDQFGKQLVSPLITIYDDGYDPAGLPQTFDFEGVPKQRVVMIERGVAQAVVYDSFTAGREHKPNTGHALPAPNSFGPMPLHTMMEAGEHSLEEMIGKIDHGIYVTRFQHTNPLHPLRTIFSGTTRDGTFLIEHGELTRPIKNLRFSQSILDTLRATQAVGKDRIQYVDYIPIVAPALYSTQFHVTGIAS